MAEILFDADINMSGVGKLVRALLNPVAADPGSPAEGEVWYNTTSDRLKVRANGVSEEVAWFSEVSAGGVPASTWDAQSVVVAVTDDTPVAQVLAANTYLGRRASGDITAVTLADLATDLEGTGLEASTLGGVAVGALVQEADYNAQTVLVAVTDNTPVAQTVGANTYVGRRATGDVTAVTLADLATDLEGTGLEASTLSGIAAGAFVQEADYDANSTLVAVSDNTPVVQTFAASTILGRRAAGNVTAITYADLVTDLSAAGLATDAEVTSAINAVIDAAPGTLDTLNELAAALGDDANFAATTAASLATKVNSFSANFGDASSQSFNIDHNLGTLDVQVQVFVNSNGAEVVTGVARTTTNRVVITTNSSPGTNAYRVVVQGRA